MLKVLLVGGGTGGSITPLLAVQAEIKKENPETQFFFIGPRTDDLAKNLAEKFGIPYQSIHAGKLRRYFDIKNLASPFLVMLGFLESLKIIWQFKPDVVISAGSFAAVPVGMAGWVFRIPLFIHQQDVIPSLTNLILSPFAHKITVALPSSLADFSSKKTILTGNPVRKDIFDASLDKSRDFFSLKQDMPVILVLGGGKGAFLINRLIYSLIPRLASFCQIIHLTGKNKSQSLGYENYHQFEFLTSEIAFAYRAADIVVCRAGMGTLSEISVLGKPAIVLPIANSHQEANAQYFLRKKAIRALFGPEQNKKKLLEEIKLLIKNPYLRQQLSQNIKKIIHPDAASKIAKLIICKK